MLCSDWLESNRQSAIASVITALHSTMIGQFLTLTASSILLLLIVDDALSVVYNENLSLKSQ